MKTTTTANASTPSTITYPRKFRSLAGGGKNLYRIEAGEGWDRVKWGNPPYFGKVRADSEYWAIYEAYDRLKVIPNGTFKLKVTQLEVTNAY